MFAITPVHRPSVKPSPAATSSFDVIDQVFAHGLFIEHFSTAGRPERPRRDRRDRRRRTMSRCQRKIVPGVTISRIAARRSIGTVPASSASHARSGHVNRARAPGLSRPATASRCRSIKISASLHHNSRRDNPSSDTARETIRKISFNPTSRKSSHPLSSPPAAGHGTKPTRAPQGIYPGGIGFRHPQGRQQTFN